MTTHQLANMLLKKEDVLAVILNLEGDKDESHLIEPKHIDYTNASKGGKICVISYNSKDI